MWCRAHSTECYGQQGPGQLYTALRHQHGRRLQQRSGMSAWSLVVLLAIDIDPDLWCCMATGLDYGRHPDMALNSSVGQDFTMASGGKAGYSHLAVPLHSPVSSSIFLHNAQTTLLLFLTHLSTIYLHTVAAPAVDHPASRSLGIFPREYF